MVMTMMPNPPHRPVLAGKHAEQGKNELEYAGGLEGSVREQSMIAHRDAEDLKRACDQEGADGNVAPADDKNQSASQVQQDEGREECNVSR